MIEQLNRNLTLLTGDIKELQSDKKPENRKLSISSFYTYDEFFKYFFYLVKVINTIKTGSV